MNGNCTWVEQMEISVNKSWHSRCWIDWNVLWLQVLAFKGIECSKIEKIELLTRNEIMKYFIQLT